MTLIDILPIPITVMGVFFLIKLRFFFIVHPIKTAKQIAVSLKDSSSRRSLALALAGTLGIGNIVGVAYGLCIGGAGSLFWIFASGIFASVIKYAESSLAAEFRDTGHGGMMYVIMSSFKKLGKPIACIYAVLCIMLSLTMGSALQAESAAAAAEYSVKIAPEVFIALFALAVFAVICFGTQKIERATAIIIPLSTIIYIIGCLSVIFMNTSKLGAVIVDIFASAFNIKSALGGGIALLSSRALREGYARGLLSNEAGAGTSAAAQSRSSLKSSHEVGLLGMCEVFFDTTLLCMLTGFAVLTSGVPLSGSGIKAVLDCALASFGSVSAVMLFVLISLFAYSTVVCWYFYGSECIYFLTGRERSLCYTVIFIISLVFGAKIKEAFLITASDYTLFFMTLITLLALLKNSERIKHLSE